MVKRRSPDPKHRNRGGTPESWAPSRWGGRNSSSLLTPAKAAAGLSLPRSGKIRDPHDDGNGRNSRAGVDPPKASRAGVDSRTFFAAAIGGDRARADYDGRSS